MYTSEEAANDIFDCIDTSSAMFESHDGDWRLEQLTVGSLKLTRDHVAEMIGYVWLRDIEATYEDRAADQEKQHQMTLESEA